MGLFSKGDGFDDKDYDAWRVHGAVNNVLGSDRLDNVFHDLAPDFDANLQKAGDLDTQFDKAFDNRDYACYYSMLSGKYKDLEAKYNTMKEQYNKLKESISETNYTSITH